MEPGEIQRYLYAHIPLSRAMELSVVVASPERVQLSAPLAPNINHRETAFGGSVSALAILSAWTLLYIRLEAERLATRLVIQRNTMCYDAPVTGTFFADAALRDPAQWGRFLQTMRRRGRARITVASAVSCNGSRAGEFEGEFVALTIAPPNGAQNVEAAS
jgi:thioesterase domain-containing protein